ncbi:hypothetical protein CK203_112805 [Vitis vinifera]|uniref:Retrovirus-related Pol polyprotein from transposon RE1 n=1 Tax=Vitis vinifera TaxID=29760 RepID=A0A438CCS5_VITVI|nr:hypothetical protein CK203_112805 [Vitis vinifera]
MEEAKTMKTPMSSSIKLDMDEKGKPINSTMYRGMIGSLLYLTASRPDIMYSGFGLKPRVSPLESVSSAPCVSGLFSSISRRLGAQGKRPVEPSQPSRRRLAERRAGLPDSCGLLFSATYGLGGPVLSTVRGVEIRLSPESICAFSTSLLGLRVYEAKAWPTVPGFEPREAVQRLCGLADPQGMGKPSAHSLTVTSRVLHHMICSILLPRGGHRDEVSYLEAFIVTRSSPGDGFMLATL